MSVQSMTGFGRGEAANQDFCVTVEIKSVNHRFKDTRFRMPSLFSSLEIELKGKLAAIFPRGSFDISINYKRTDGQKKFEDLDDEKIKAYMEKIKNIADIAQIEIRTGPCEFLRGEFYKDADENNEEVVRELCREAFIKASSELKKAREIEGQKLIDVLKGHLEEYQKYLAVIIEKADTFQADVEEKLRKKIDDYREQIRVEESRILQEVVFYLEKMDVHEEINRIKSHLEKFSQLLKKETEIGREVDFFIQELNRETNTIGSKSSRQEISNAVIQMKVQLEKIREQGLNLQ